MSLFREKQLVCHIPLTPYYGKPELLKQGVDEFLNEHFLLKYKSEFGGVALGFWDVSVFGSSATIFNEAPYLHTKIKLTTLLFTPALGMKICKFVFPFSRVAHAAHTQSHVHAVH
jgi:hypothetical protein